MRLEWPLALLALLVLPLAVGIHLLAARRRMRHAVRFTNLEVLAGVVERIRPWRQRAPALLALLALALLAASLARPHVAVSAAAERATVVLVIDTSGSMEAGDVEPTRLGAAQAAVRTFLGKVPKQMRVAIVSFSGDVQVVAPPTTDRELLRLSLDYLRFGFRTAIGDALGRAVQVAAASEQGEPGAEDAPPPAPEPGAEGEKPLNAILLLSDGYQNFGVLEPGEAAQRAKARGIPVFTVALGTPEGVLERDWYGSRRIIPVPPDPETLRQIASATGGEAFEARDARKLNAVYESLGSRLGRVPEEREVTVGFLAGGAALLLSALLLSALWAPRLP